MYNTEKIAFDQESMDQGQPSSASATLQRRRRHLGKKEAAGATTGQALNRKAHTLRPGLLAQIHLDLPDHEFAELHSPCPEPQHPCDVTPAKSLLDTVCHHGDVQRLQHPGSGPRHHQHREHDQGEGGRSRHRCRCCCCCLPASRNAVLSATEQGDAPEWQRATTGVKVRYACALYRARFARFPSASGVGDKGTVSGGWVPRGVKGFCIRPTGYNPLGWRTTCPSRNRDRNIGGRNVPVSRCSWIPGGVNLGVLSAPQTGASAGKVSVFAALLNGLLWLPCQ